MTDTDLSLTELVAWLADQTWSDFAQSLAAYHAKKGLLTPKQEAAARKMHATCLAKAAAKAAPKTVVMPDISAGYYAVPAEDGVHDLTFYRVDRPTKGHYAGLTFVKHLVGGDKAWPVKGAAAVSAVEAVLAVGETAAMKLYADEFGRCGKCNRTLTDAVSRHYGIGPDCRKGMSLPAATTAAAFDTLGTIGKPFDTTDIDNLVAATTAAPDVIEAGPEYVW